MQAPTSPSPHPNTHLTSLSSHALPSPSAAGQNSSLKTSLPTPLPDDRSDASTANKIFLPTQTHTASAFTSFPSRHDPFLSLALCTSSVGATPSGASTSLSVRSATFPSTTSINASPSPPVRTPHTLDRPFRTRKARFSTPVAVWPFRAQVNDRRLQELDFVLVFRCAAEGDFEHPVARTDELAVGEASAFYDVAVVGEAHETVLAGEFVDELMSTRLVRQHQSTAREPALSSGLMY